jgi:glutamate/tyrosine decarboxylase-like PLP-dependent enzyme
MAPVSLNIVCCRLQPPSVPPDQWDLFNADVVAQLQESGIAAPSTCRINGDLCIRICIINHRTTEHDMDILMNALLDLAHKSAD